MPQQALRVLINRRQALGLLAGTALFTMAPKAQAQIGNFKITDGHQVHSDYTAQLLIRWGDPILRDTPKFDPQNQTKFAQERQFGFNNDYLVYLPLNGRSDHGLLWVNHEYTRTSDMFPGNPTREAISPAQIMVEQMAHGGSVLEVKLGPQGWEVVFGDYNRRITAQTPMDITGPAAGHKRMQTVQDPTGRKVLGMLSNCAGGVTPWGTILSAEENIDFYFDGPMPASEARNYKRMGITGGKGQNWQGLDHRFDMARNDREANRFGWIVEIDPLDPTSTLKKRTALGRFKHECATTAQSLDGRLVIYSGDDEADEYLYRYISNAPIAGSTPDQLLDHGILYVAQFDEHTLRWLPLVFGHGPLTPQNDFHSQADVLIETRRAADLMGATPMDRPEDVEVHQKSGRVYVMLSNNKDRTETDAANPRGPNPHGHILELIPPNGDHGADVMNWDILVMGGPDHSGKVWLSCPDNGAILDDVLYIATDQGSAQGRNNIPDGLYRCPLFGPNRGQLEMIFAGPIDAEATGPFFTPDGKNLFVSVQHPGEGSGFDAPNTRWPDFSPNTPPRPSVMVLRRKDGGRF